MEIPVSTQLLAAQEVVVLHPTGPVTGTWVVIPPAPAWWMRLGRSPAGDEHPFRPIEVFPYLESCWPEAERVWSTPSSPPHRSGYWSEAGPGGEEFHLEATALTAGPQAFLLLRRAEAEYAARQEMLQMARERMLDHERLLKEMSAKEVLLHCIVHDLAGPLASIQGCLEILARESLDPEAAEFVQMGLLQVARQNRLIRDLLDVFKSQIHALDQLVADPAHAPDLRTCVIEVMDGLRPAFLVKRVELESATQPGAAPVWPVAGERSRLERVLYNLLENALRFAPPESVVRVELADEGTMFSVTVADQGPGVAPEVKARLFQRFIAGGRLPGKSGLGLYFCRITVERWGGSIECDSQPGAGARFRIRLRKVTSPGE